jgi:uncharacterized protein YaiI (UPF0178 family)
LSFIYDIAAKASRPTCAPELAKNIDGITTGPAPFAKADRSRFLQALDEVLVRLG